MFIKCLCGQVLNDTAAPNDVEHILMSYQAMERLQDLADEEVAAEGAIHCWPEHWEVSGAIKIWKCGTCSRLYFGIGGKPEKIIIYKIEQTGLP